MARPLRVERPAAWYHVTGRGLERRPIFRDDLDRNRWMALVAEAVPMFGWVVHGYTLMDNHYHLILQILETNLSRGMQWFQTSYSMGFNRRHNRVGPLVQGRFGAILVDPIGWGLELSRYVHLNPVRTARMGLDKRARKADRLGIGGKPDAEQVRERLQRLRHYPWSSYRAYAGLAKRPQWLTCNVVLEMVGRGTLRDRQQAYTKYVEGAVREGVEESLWEHLEGRLILGSRHFIEEVSKQLRGSDREQPQRRALARRPKWEEVVKAVERVRGETWPRFRDRYGDRGRDLALYFGRKAAGLGLRELGMVAGGLDYATVSVAIKRFERRMTQDKNLRKIATSVAQLLNVET
ncbi:MAG TPA: transposase [Verrucomicrobiae bacterium]|nr:transposase [Verrucomicrobiae bacterium]